MGQQPNIAIGVEDLPRHTAHPPAPGRWSPDRPGDLSGPSAVPRGGSFGAPGPDAGYALRLVSKSELLPGGAHRGDIVALVAAVVTARAAAFGRAPLPGDVAAAVALLHLDESQTAALAGIAHDHARLQARVGEIAPDRLTLPASRLVR